MTARLGPDPRALALFRIALGVVLIEDFVHHACGAALFYGEHAILAHAPLTIAEWTAFALPGAGWTYAVFALGIAAAVAFTLGLFTRTATVVLWLALVSRMHRAPELHNGGDALAAILLMFGGFAGLGARGSLDARRGARGGGERAGGLAAVLLMAVPAVLYAHTAWLKLQAAGGEWLDGTVLYENLHLAGWRRLAGPWLGDHPGLCTLLGASTIAIELAIPLLLAASLRWRRVRGLVVVLHVGLQLGILTTLKVGVFTNVMLAVTALWLPPAWLDRIWPPRAEVRGPRSEARTGGPVDAIAAMLFVAVACAPIVQLPVVSRAFALDLNATLFTRAYPSIRWVASGELRDGQRADPLLRLSTGAVLDDGPWNSLWMQLPYRVQDYDTLGRAVCACEPDLRAWKLIKLVREPAAPDAAEPAPTENVVVDHTCEERAGAS